MKYIKIFVFLIVLMVFLVSCQKTQSLDLAVKNEMTNTNSKIDLPFDYIIVSGEKSLKTCLELREEYKGKYTPVILGTSEDINNLEYSIENNKDSINDIIKKSKNYNAETIIKERLNEDSEYYNIVEEGDWPAALDPIQTITANIDILSGEYLKEVYIGLVPTGNSYEVPAYLKFGGWNECPAPEEQVGILRYWYEKYGAQIISLTSDVLECTVSNPPKTKVQSMDLAREQYFYCPDIVFQGTGDISVLAGSLFNSEYWYFWWD